MMKNLITFIILITIISCASPTDGEIFYIPIESGLHVEENWYTGEGCEMAFVKNKSTMRITFKIKINKMERVDESSPWIQKESIFERITLNPSEQKELYKTLQFIHIDRRYLGSVLTEGKRFSYEIVDATHRMLF